MHVKNFVVVLVMIVSMLCCKISLAQNTVIDFPKTTLHYQWTTSASLAVKDTDKDYNKHISDYQLEEVPGTKRRNTGIVLTALGAGLLATGIGLVATSESLHYSSNTNTYSGTTQTSGDLGGALGVLAIPASLGLLIPGIYQWVKGVRVMKANRNNKTSYLTE